MDPQIAPLILLALGAGMYGVWTNMRESLQPAECAECPHCRAVIAERQALAQEEVRKQAELRTWYARRHGLERDEDDDRR